MREGTPSSSLTNEELQFCAEDETVVIVPNLSLESLHLISGEFGPFRAQSEAVVPMWLATMLRKRHQCRIKPPEWMHATNLGNVLKDEKANATAWQQLPYHYIEIAKILFTVAEEDFAEFDMDVNEIRRLVDDIRIVRFDKLEKQFKQVTGANMIRLENLCAMELNLIRPFLLGTLNQYRKLSQIGEEEPAAGGATPGMPEESPASRAPPIRRLRD